MNNNSFNLEHLDALLADRALQGADPAEEAAIRCLMQNQPGVDTESLDRAAAALDLALQQGHEEPLPAHLMNRLQVQAGEFTFDPQANPPVVEPAPTPPPPGGVGPRGAGKLLAWTGWLVAAVALVVAFLPPVPQALTVEQLKQRNALDVAGAPTPAGTPGMKGQFIWDSQSQQGYMKLSGFTVNDPTVSQLQLWIFDEKDFTAKYPIDGGVFDIKSNQEVLIPIKPNIKVGMPTLFAITVERPGGVTVSERKKLIFAGKVGVNPKS